jgi:hypothetical protein
VRAFVLHLLVMLNSVSGSGLWSTEFREMACNDLLQVFAEMG